VTGKGDSWMHRLFRTFCTPASALLTDYVNVKSSPVCILVTRDLDPDPNWIRIPLGPWGIKSGSGPKAGEDQIRTPKKKNKVSCLEKF
jgi:hypothetical protein